MPSWTCKNISNGKVVHKVKCRKFKSELISLDYYCLILYNCEAPWPSSVCTIWLVFPCSFVLPWQSLQFKYNNSVHGKFRKHTFSNWKLENLMMHLWLFFASNASPANPIELQEVFGHTRSQRSLLLITSTCNVSSLSSTWNLSIFYLQTLVPSTYVFLQH